MRIFEQGVDRDEEILSAFTYGSPASDPELESVVRKIITQVRASGDAALLEYGRKHDSPSLKDIIVPPPELEKALNGLETSLLNALKRAADNIQTFHEQEKQKSWITSSGSTTLGQIVNPLESVGVYVPGGRAAYPSTVLMTTIPAAVAGVKNIFVATPVDSGGDIPAVVKAACRLCGVTTVFKMGGAQAIAAFAYGTQSVPRVDKIVGPGNQYVNMAKRLVFGQVGIDSLAGPSEVLIVADSSAPAEWVAADIIAQAEHGSESKTILITWSRLLADKVLSAVSAQIVKEPRESHIREALGNRGIMLVVNNESDALDWIESCAPEHLQLIVRDPQEWIGRIKNAGAIFVGPYSPVPIGDYVAGPSHTLPTGTSARFSSGLGVADFQKRTSLIWYGRKEFMEDAPSAMTIASAEGLNAHITSVAIRLKEESS